MPPENKHPLLSPVALWMSPLLIGAFFLLLLPFWNPQQKEVYLKSVALLFAGEAFLMALLVPLGLSLPGKGDSLYLCSLVILTSLVFLNSLLPGKIYSILEVEASLLAFGGLIFTVAWGLKKILPPLFSQLAASLLGFLLLSSFFLAPFLLSFYPQKERALRFLLLSNPFPSGLYRLTGWDLFRFSWMYDFSPISDYPFTYPSPLEVTWTYGIIILLLSVLGFSIYAGKKGYGFFFKK